jgi:hypothetical protein
VVLVVLLMLLLLLLLVQVWVILEWVLVLLVLVLVQVQNLWEASPPEETSSREDAPEGAPRRKPPGRVAVTRTTVS